MFSPEDTITNNEFISQTSVFCLTQPDAAYMAPCQRTLLLSKTKFTHRQFMHLGWIISQKS